MFTPDVTLTVYFCGSGVRLPKASDQSPECLTGLFADNTDATDITNKKDIPENAQLKMGFDGCDANYGLLGLFFGYGLDQQSNKVVKKIKQLKKMGKKVRLNIVGYSRGGIGCMLTAKKLAGINPDELETNMLLIDPVPGELPSLTRLDKLKIGYTSRIMDLSNSKNLKNVKTVYVTKSGAGIFNKFFTPIRPRYPERSCVQEDVMLGEHKEIMGYDYDQKENLPIFDRLAFCYIYDFLQDNETKLKKPTDAIQRRLFSERGILRRKKYVYSKLKGKNKKEKRFTSRSTHPDPKFGSTYIEGKRGKCDYLNHYHKKLAKELKLDMYVKATNNPTYKLELSDPYYDNKNEQESKLYLFCAELYNSMSKTSRKGSKGKGMMAFKKLIRSSSNLSKQQKESVLRDVLALALQRDRNGWSLYNTTTSGLKARKLLNTNKYASLKQLIDKTGNEVKYQDLRTFVRGKICGENNINFFKVKNKKRNYHKLLLFAQSKKIITDVNTGNKKFYFYRS